LPVERVGTSRRSEAGATLARRLKIRPGDGVVRLDRLRYADSIPIAVERAHLPENRVPGILALGSPNALYWAVTRSGNRPRSQTPSAAGEGASPAEQGRVLPLLSGRGTPGAYGSGVTRYRATPSAGTAALIAPAEEMSKVLSPPTTTDWPLQRFCTS